MRITFTPQIKGKLVDIIISNVALTHKVNEIYTLVAMHNAYISLSHMVKHCLNEISTLLQERISH